MVTAAKTHLSKNEVTYSLKKLEEINKKIFTVNMNLINNDTSSNIKNLSNEECLHLEIDKDETVCVSYHYDEEFCDSKKEG